MSGQPAVQIHRSARKRPVLRYHGGKFRLAPWVLALFPGHRIYTEAYGGGGSILMQKERSHAEIYNDLDDEVVGVFRVLRNRETAGELERLLRLTPFSRNEFMLAYTPSEDPVERARRTIIKSFMGFGSDSIHRRQASHRGFNTRVSSDPAPTGFRSQSRRSGSTPARDWDNYAPSIASFCERLQGVVIENRPALEVIRKFDDEECLHYVDPPYPMSTRTDRSGQYRFEMKDWDHEELAHQLHSVNGMVVISSYPSELYSRLYGDWRCETLTTSRSCHNGGMRTEALWLNAAAAERVPVAKIVESA